MEINFKTRSVLFINILSVLTERIVRPWGSVSYCKWLIISPHIREEIMHILEQIFTRLLVSALPLPEMGNYHTIVVQIAWAAFSMVLMCRLCYTTTFIDGMWNALDDFLKGSWGWEMMGRENFLLYFLSKYCLMIFLDLSLALQSYYAVLILHCWPFRLLIFASSPRS